MLEVITGRMFLSSMAVHPAIKRQREDRHDGTTHGARRGAGCAEWLCSDTRMVFTNATRSNRTAGGFRTAHEVHLRSTGRTEASRVVQLAIPWRLSLSDADARPARRHYSPRFDLPRPHAYGTRDTRTTNTLDAVTATCISLVVLIAGVGIQGLQEWLERWDYNRHCND